MSFGIFVSFWMFLAFQRKGNGLGEDPF
jgi:hypothetical protein